MAKDTMDRLTWLRKVLSEGDVDLMREMPEVFAEELMGAEADSICGATGGERSDDRVNRRNGYRGAISTPAWAQSHHPPPSLGRAAITRAGCWRTFAAERALVAVIAECHVRGVSTRRVDSLVKTLGIEGISLSQVSRMARSLDDEVAARRSLPLDGGS